MKKTTRPDGDRGRQGNGKSPRPTGGIQGTPPPPDSTGFEERYLSRRAETGSPLRVRMVGGECIEGLVREFDRDTLEVESAGRRVRLRKSSVQFLEEA